MPGDRTVLVSQDLLSGVVAMLLGAAGVYFGRVYPIGTAIDMGPGYLPRVVSLSLVALGAVLAARGLMARHARIGRVPLRSSVLVLASMLLFAALIERAGLALACFTTFLVCAFATPEVRWREAVALAVGLSAFAVAIFVYGLGQPIPIWPRW